MAAAVVAAAGVGYLVVNHLASSMRRISGITALTAAHQPVMPAATRHSMTVLLTGSNLLPPVRHGDGILGSSKVPEDISGMVALIHLNANQRAGAVIAIPPNAVVPIPGHGRQELWDALSIGGPSLLIRTVERLTNVRIDHYSVLDFRGAKNIVRAMHGVDVTVPYTVTSEGHTFHAGVNHLYYGDVLAYVRQPGVSEIGRTYLEVNLVRAIMRKIASRHLLSGVSEDFGVLEAISRAMAVDSNFSNTGLESLAIRLSVLRGSNGVFVSAPTRNGSPTSGEAMPVFLRRRISRLLWRAIRHDRVEVFADRFPFTITPGAPG